MKKIKALFHFKRESIPPESLIELEIHPNDTPNVLRKKAAFLLSSYFAQGTIYRDPETWFDIAQHLAYQRNGKNEVTREDLVELIQALKDPAKERNGELLLAMELLLREDYRYNKPPREGL